MRRACRCPDVYKRQEVGRARQGRLAPGLDGFQVLIVAGEGRVVLVRECQVGKMCIRDSVLPLPHLAAVASVTSRCGAA